MTDYVSSSSSLGVFISLIVCQFQSFVYDEWVVSSYLTYYRVWTLHDEISGKTYKDFYGN